MKVKVTMELEVDMQSLEFETERGREVALEMFEESLEKAIEDNIERSWGFSDWPVVDIPPIHIFAEAENADLAQELESLRTRAGGGLDDDDQARLEELEEYFEDLEYE